VAADPTSLAVVSDGVRQRLRAYSNRPMDTKQVDA